VGQLDEVRRAIEEAIQLKPDFTWSISFSHQERAPASASAARFQACFRTLDWR
jgi:hypothetical protein